MIDIGLNLGNSQFDHDRTEAVARAQEAGVEALILTGTDLAESQAAATLASHWPGYAFSTAGVHPHDARHWDERSAEVVRQLARLPQVEVACVLAALAVCGVLFIWRASFRRFVLAGLLLVFALLGLVLGGFSPVLAGAALTTFTVLAVRRVVLDVFLAAGAFAAGAGAAFSAGTRAAACASRSARRRAFSALAANFCSFRARFLTVVMLEPPKP